MRILLLIPHPDDEVVGCAASLRRARTEGAASFGLYLTTGVPPRENLWPWQRRDYGARIARRRREAEEAAARLALEPAGFLDIPARRLKTHIAAAMAAIDAAITRHTIDAIWVPAWEGGHQDHDVANFIAAGFTPRCPITEFAEYNFAGGAVRSGRFALPNGSEETLQLSVEAQEWKRALLALYRSERGNLAHVAVRCEERRPLARYDYRKPPHRGPLFRERFQWLPFQHPRIDGEATEDVLAVLQAFAETAGGGMQNQKLLTDARQAVADGEHGG